MWTAFRRASAAALALAALGLAPHAAAQDGSAGAAEITEGQDIALNACASCHVVASGQGGKPALTPPAPSFAEIANDPKTSRDGLIHVATTRHWDEKAAPPHTLDTFLTDGQAEDVVSYILSLRTQH